MYLSIELTITTSLLLCLSLSLIKNQAMGAKKKGGGAKKGGKGKKDKKPRDAVGEAVNEVEEAERKVSTRLQVEQWTYQVFTRK